MKFKRLLLEGQRHNKKLLHYFGTETPGYVKDILNKGVAVDLTRFVTEFGEYMSPNSSLWNLGDGLDEYGQDFDKTSKVYKRIVVDPNKFKTIWTEVGKKVLSVIKKLELYGADLLSDFTSSSGLYAYVRFMQQKARWNDDTEDPIDKYYSIMERLFTLIPRTLRDLNNGAIRHNVQRDIFPALEEISRELDALL